MRLENNLSQNENPILFSEMGTGQYKIGVVTLNRPQSLNALNIDCYKRLEPKLLEWAQDHDISAIVIESSNEKAFCAGGDVKNLVLQLNSQGLQPAKDFFTLEYFVDGLIHYYPKPVIAIAPGILMGGGLGLIHGASHRIITESTTVAMPEVAIGLFPDVGATHFLAQLPYNVGLVMGLTGLRLKGEDIVRIGLLDYFMPIKKRDRILADLMRLQWSANALQNKRMLDVYFHQMLSPIAQTPEVSELQSLLAALPTQNFIELSDALMQLKSGSENVQKIIDEAQSRFQAGSKLAQHVFYEAYLKHKKLSIRETLEHEWSIAIRFCEKSDFHEGVRAVLIDKDNQTKWMNNNQVSKLDIEWAMSAIQPNLLSEKFRKLYKEISFFD